MLKTPDMRLLYYLVARKWLYLHTRDGTFMDLPATLSNDIALYWSDTKSYAFTMKYTESTRKTLYYENTVQRITFKGLWYLHMNKHHIHDFYTQFFPKDQSS